MAKEKVKKTKDSVHWKSVIYIQLGASSLGCTPKVFDVAAPIAVMISIFEYFRIFPHPVLV